MSKILRLHEVRSDTGAAINETKRILQGLVLAAAILSQLDASARQTPVDLGSAASFAVLAGSTVTSTGPTAINGGNVGVSPGSSVTGFPPAVITAPFTIHAGDTVALQAQNALTGAYNNAAGRVPTQVLTGQNLGGLTLTPGVYFFSASSQLTGTLTLNDEGDANAVFIFQIGSTLTTASDSSVVTINGGATPGNNVIWQIGSSATLGADTAFEGNILADTSITLNAGATILEGRVLAMNGAVTLDDNSIGDLFSNDSGPGGSGGATVPDTGGTFLLLAAGLAALFAFGRRLSVLLG